MYFCTFLSFDILDFATEIGLETNTTDGPETHASDHWHRDIDRSESLILSAIRSSWWWYFFQNFCTATIAIINLILFVLPGNHPTYYQTTTAILGKMYSNTMMVTLNSRITISKKGESTSGSTDYSTSSNSEIRRRLPNPSLGDITVTQEQWSTLPEIHLPEIHNLNVSMAIQSSSHWYWYGR